MTKSNFMTELQTRLSGLPQQDLEERLSFYSEMIDDRIEEGVSEDEAVDEIGNMEEIVSQILADYPLAKIVKEKVKPKHRLQPWEIILLVLGSPIWLSLLIAAFAIVLSLYIVIWSLIISLWAVFASAAVLSPYGFLMAVVYTIQGNAAAGAAYLGIGIFCIGISILLFFGCIASTKGTAVLTKKMILGIKALLVRKESSK